MRSSFTLYALVISVVGCNAITGIGDLTRSESSGGGVDGGGTIPGCTGGILYVSPAGNDRNDGCSQEKPVATVGRALQIGKAQGSAAGEIHACKGVYSEPGLVLDFPASLRGGYDCTAWTRTTTFGSPTFDGTNATEIDFAGNGASGTNVTLTISGNSVGASITVDGLKIVGAGGNASSIAVNVAGASPVLENDIIAGGGPNESASNIASIGVNVGGGGSPEIRFDQIGGGTGVSTSSSASSTGSIAVAIGADAKSPSVHDDEIDGGSGKAASGAGSVGIAIVGGTPAIFSKNDIHGGTGAVTNTGDASAAVSSVAAATIELDGNTIDGGGGSCATATGACVSVGVVAGVGTLILRSNKIYGGDATGSTANGSVGVSISGLASFTAENNMIHGGNKTADTKHGSARAIEMTETSGPILRANTLYSGSPGSDASTASGGLAIDPNVSGIVAENNLFATSGTRDSGLIVACSPSLVAQFENNVFLTETDALVYGGGGTGTCGGSAQSFTAVSGLSSLESFLKASSNGATVSGNVLTTAVCNVGDTTCVSTAACTTSSACEAAIFAGWSTSDTGFSTLTGAGWKVNPLCVVSHGGLDLSSVLTTDLYGAPRTAPFSAGAHEQDATCM